MNSPQTEPTPTASETQDARRGQTPAHGSRPQRMVNWALALSTLLGAAVVVVFAYGQVLGTAACSDRTCPRLGLGEVAFGIILYGAPIVAIATIALSFLTAGHRRGIVVPLCAWALLGSAFATLAVALPQGK